MTVSMKIAFYILWSVAIILAYANVYFLWKGYKSQVEYLERQEENEYPAINIVNFDYYDFTGDYDRKICAINKQRYLPDTAEGIAKRVLCDSYEEKVVRITDGYVRYQIYYTDDNEKMMGWFLLSEPQ